jgi:hypothetical protein
MFVDTYLIIVAVTTLWLLIDARSIGVRKGAVPGFFDMGVAGWFFSCLLMWIVAFPAYLVKRSEYKQAKASPAADVIGQLERLQSLRQSGALSEEEFRAQKQRIIPAR